MCLMTAFILLIASGIISYQSVSCPRYIIATKWLTLICVGLIVTIVILVKPIKSTEVEHVESAVEYIDEVPMEVSEMDSCKTDKVEVEVHLASETASVPVVY